MTTINTRILIGLGALLVLGGLYVAFSAKVPLLETGNAASAWIEVTNANVYLLRADSSNEKEFHSGDEVAPGSTIRSSASGRATVHLPDGSVLRLDKDSTITLESASYNASDGTLKVRVTLLSGRVWSKVVALVTPASSWEVRTSNAVATVRGTAFLTEFRGGKSRVQGSEHTVVVRPIDPNTNAPAEEAKVEVAENAVVEIGAAQTEALRERKVPVQGVLAVKQASTQELNETWVRESKDEDKKLDERVKVIEQEVDDKTRVREELRRETEESKGKIRTLREDKKSDKEITEELKKENIETFEVRLKERLQEERREEKEVPQEIKKEERGEEKILETKKKEEPAPARGSATGGSSVVSTAKPTGITLSGPVIRGPVQDGATLSFAVYLVKSDGSKEDITSKALWKISGNVGSVGARGVFTAKLREEDSEIGEIKGSLQALYESFVSEVIEFIVTPNVEETESRG